MQFFSLSLEGSQEPHMTRGAAQSTTNGTGCFGKNSRSIPVIRRLIKRHSQIYQNHDILCPLSLAFQRKRPKAVIFPNSLYFHLNPLGGGMKISALILSVDLLVRLAAEKEIKRVSG